MTGKPARIRAIAGSVWSGLALGVSWAGLGLFALHGPHADLLSWALTLVAVGALASLAATGIGSGQSDALPVTDPAGPLGSGPTIALDSKTADLIERIEHARFDTTRFSPGYHQGEVDAFLDQRVMVLRRAGRPEQGELVTARFAATRLRPGYAMQDDRLLREIAQATLV